MNRENDLKMTQLFNGLTDKTICVYYGKIPEECNVRSAVQLKREGRYEESLTLYLDIILNKRYMLTELGRAMSKTLCAMNEYMHAYTVLYACAKVKWEANLDGIRNNPIFLGASQIFLDALASQTSHTPCASDYYELTDCLESVLQNNFSPILKRSAELSGNPNYVPIKSNADIYQQAQRLNELGAL